jgi:SAM-dependent methyltransferase
MSQARGQTASPGFAGCEDAQESCLSHTAGPFKDHFSQVAATYSQFRPLYPAALFEHLAALCTDRARAWDCACGSGQASVALAEVFASVVATDASATQISAARAHPRVAYRVAPAEDSGIETASVDLVAVAQALHWLDLERFYGEVRRVLKAGGVLAVWSYGPLEVEGEEVDAPLQQFYREIVGPFWPPERAHVEDGYARLPFPFAQVDTPRFNMETCWTLPHLLGYVRSWSATTRYVQREGHDPVDPLEERLVPLWGGGDRTRRIRWPLALRCGLLR